MPDEPLLPRDDRERGHAHLRFSKEDADRIESAARRRGIITKIGLRRLLHRLIMRDIDEDERD